MATDRNLQRTYIREWRLERGMTLPDLAEKAGVDKGNLSKIERALLPYNQDLLEKLSNILKVEVGQLISRPPNSARPLWLTYEKAPAEVKRQIEEVAETLLRTAR